MRFRVVFSLKTLGASRTLQGGFVSFVNTLPTSNDYFRQLTCYCRT